MGRTGTFIRLVGCALSLLIPLAAKSLESRLQGLGLVDIQRIDSSIQVELKYATSENFMHENVYGDLRHCYLQKDVARMLAKAQVLLRQQHAGFSLKVFDGARPRSVQWIMWKIVRGTDQEKYVANPVSGSIHNFGSAVDLTIVNDDGDELDMGTPYDFLGELAQPRYEARFVKEGRLNATHLRNRALLAKVMIGAGFQPIPNEWWHFDAFPRSVVKRKYRIIE
jgi:zinc D-Ala-D-Ala dipeptidase